MIKNVVVVASGKGGVGKSTVAVNLSVSLAISKNLKVGLLDADIYGPSSANDKKKMLPYNKFSIKSMSIGNMIPNDKAIIWRGVMASSAIRQMLNDVEWGELDFLVIDLPPGTGDIQLSLCQNLMIDGAVIVSTPQQVALLDVRKAINMFEKVNVPILGMIQNMSYLEMDKKKNYIFGKDGALKEAKKQKINFLGDIPVISGISSSGDEGEPLASKKNTKVYDIFSNVAKELVNVLAKQKKSKVKISN